MQINNNKYSTQKAVAHVQYQHNDDSTSYQHLTLAVSCSNKSLLLSALDNTQYSLCLNITARQLAILQHHKLINKQQTQRNVELIIILILIYFCQLLDGVHTLRL